MVFKQPQWTVNCKPLVETFVKAELWFQVTKVLKKPKIEKAFHSLFWCALTALVFFFNFL